MAPKVMMETERIAELPMIFPSLSARPTANNGVVICPERYFAQLYYKTSKIQYARER